MDQQTAIQELAKTVERLANILRMYKSESEDGVLDQVLREITDDAHAIYIKVEDV